MGLPPQYYKAKEASAKQEEEKVGESQKHDASFGEVKSDVGEPSKSDVSQTQGGKTQDDPASEDLPKDVDEESDDEDDHYSRPLSEYIPEGQFLFLPPARYVFTGAEVYPESSDDEDDDHDEPSSDPRTGSNDQPDEFEMEPKPRLPE